MALESAAAVAGSCGRIVEMEEEIDTLRAKFEEEESRHQVRAATREDTFAFVGILSLDGVVV